MNKETLEQFGFLALTVVALTISIMVFVPGAYGPISSFFDKFGGFLGAAGGVGGAYGVAAWQMNQRRIQVANAVGLELVVYFSDLRQDIEDIAGNNAGVGNEFRDPAFMQEFQANANDIIPAIHCGPLYEACHTRLSPYREREAFLAGRNSISELEYEDYFRLYLIYSKIDYIVSQYATARPPLGGHPPAMFALTLQNFIDIENNAIDVRDSLSRKYAVNLPQILRRPPPQV